MSNVIVNPYSKAKIEIKNGRWYYQTREDLPAGRYGKFILFLGYLPVY